MHALNTNKAAEHYVSDGGGDMMGTIREDMKTISEAIDSGHGGIRPGAVRTSLAPRVPRPRRPGKWSGGVTTGQTVADLDGLITALVEVVKREHYDVTEIAKLHYAGRDGSHADNILRNAVIHAMRVNGELTIRERAPRSKKERRS